MVQTAPRMVDSFEGNQHVDLSPTGQIQREICLVFDSPETFRAEYARNLSKGGAFVPTAGAFEMLEPVVVHLDALFADERISFAAEIVHSQPRNGVSVQLMDTLSEIRARLDPLLAKADALCAESGVELDVPEGPDLDALDPLDELEFNALAIDGDLELDGLPALDASDASETLAEDPDDRTHQERAQRWPARVPVQLRGPGDRVLHARSRDLSMSGVLVSVPGSRLPGDTALRLTIVHPTSRESLDVAGRVVRHLDGRGAVVAMAIRFDAGAQQVTLERFVEAIRRVHQERQQAGLSEQLDERGIAPPLKLLAAAVPRGTITVIQGVEEGTIVFDARQLLAAELGALHGQKALARLLGWTTGSFEFHANVDPAPFRDAPIALDEALDDAQRMLEAFRRGCSSAPPLTMRFRVDRDRIEWRGRELTKIESEIVERGAAGKTVREILDGIRASDAAIGEAIVSLAEDGVLLPATAAP